MNKKIVLSIVIIILSVFQSLRYQNLIKNMEISKPSIKILEVEKKSLDYREVVEMKKEMESCFGGLQHGDDVVCIHKDEGQECLLVEIRRRGSLDTAFEIASYIQKKGIGFKAVALKKIKNSSDYDIEIIVEVIVDEIV